jgi:DNA-binding NarL/FixJ family response regulator
MSARAGIRPRELIQPRCAHCGQLLPDALTPRETDVLTLLAHGMTAAEIASKLGLATKTVENQRVSILERLGARNTPHAIRIACERGILDVWGVA